MPDQDKEQQEATVKGSHEKIIRIVVDVKGGGEGAREVIVAQGSSNHYTQKAYSSDTCCTCNS